jgi:hypothetical protein
MSQTPTTPQHCPGYANFKSLKSFTCACQACGAEKEIFSDEFERPHACGKCGAAIDFRSCTLSGEGRSITPR